VLEIRRYTTRDDRDVFGDWLANLGDKQARVRITMRIDRIASGNFGDGKPLRDGVWELRVDWGPGYRVYYAMVGRACVLLLCGGDKRKQLSDITRAVAYLRDYKERTDKI
jgi:putative addiction module killer protein